MWSFLTYPSEWWGLMRGDPKSVSSCLSLYLESRGGIVRGGGVIVSSGTLFVIISWGKRGSSTHVSGSPLLLKGYGGSPLLLSGGIHSCLRRTLGT